MIPHIVHYCWFGEGELPQLAHDCIASWKKNMPDWEYMRWDESNFDIDGAPLYVRQAYEARKFAFVSDYVRLWALEQYGGLYMDVDFEVYRPFDELMDKYPAFAGYEGSKYKPVMMGVIASEAHGAWVRDMLETYKVRRFILPDGRLDMTPNTSYFSERLKSQGAILDGKEKDVFVNDEPQVLNEPLALNEPLSRSATDPHGLCVPRSLKRAVPPLSPLRYTLWGPQRNETHALNDGRIFMLHVFPVHYFCPRLTTGEDVRNDETYCEHKGESSWAQQGWKARLLSNVSPEIRKKLIKLKRSWLGIVKGCRVYGVGCRV